MILAWVKNSLKKLLKVYNVFHMHLETPEIRLHFVFSEFRQTFGFSVKTLTVHTETVVGSHKSETANQWHAAKYFGHRKKIYKIKTEK